MKPQTHVSLKHLPAVLFKISGTYHLKGPQGPSV